MIMRDNGCDKTLKYYEKKNMEPTLEFGQQPHKNIRLSRKRKTEKSIEKKKKSTNSKEANEWA